MKKAKIARLLVFQIICPECDDAIESSGSDAATTMYPEGSWHLVPEVLTCQVCGAKVARPRDPFKKATPRKSPTTSTSGYRDFPREEEYRDEHESLTRPGY
jgi:hypothetical protein